MSHIQKLLTSVVFISTFFQQKCGEVTEVTEVEPPGTHLLLLPNNRGILGGRVCEWQADLLLLVSASMHVEGWEGFRGQ